MVFICLYINKPLFRYVQLRSYIHFKFSSILRKAGTEQKYQHYYFYTALTHQNVGTVENMADKCTKIPEYLFHRMATVSC